MYVYYLSRNFLFLKLFGIRLNMIVVYVSIVLYIEENLKILFERLNIFGLKVIFVLSNEVDLDFVCMCF